MAISGAAMVKIKSYRLSQRGNRGLIVSVPSVWADDLGLKPGDRLDVYRDTEDRLIIQAAKGRTR